MSTHSLLARLPAKFSSPGYHPDAYHPLYCHMHDVAAVAAEIWDSVLTEGGHTFVASALGLDRDAARTWVRFLAGLHDLGKAAPAFLRYAPAHPAIVELGMSLPLSPAEVTPRVAPHGIVTALALEQLLRGLAVRPDMAPRMAATTGGHHGFFPARERLDEVKMFHDATGGSGWRDARATLFEAFAADLGVAQVSCPAAFGNPIAVFLAGLISVADWIGSDTSLFPYMSMDGSEPTPGQLAEYPALAKERAGKAIRRLGWRWRPPTAPAEFAQLFRFPPRGVQVDAVELAQTLRAPSITVIEAPTGEGKTEAALFLADALARTGVRGFYLALPTQATSNQLYSRVRTALARQYVGDPEPVLLQLLHGHASLSAEFEADLHDSADDFALITPTAIFDEDADAHDRIEPGTTAVIWFTHRKRGHLAPFGVGTIDQAILASLQTRHVFVRLFGLAGKTVIVDEVHAYDTYMSTLLERLLEWLAALDSPVILLSATLPSVRTRALIEAYAKGAGTVSLDGTLAKYPRITSWAGGLKLQSRPATPSDVGARTLAWEWHDGFGEGNEQALARWAAQQVTDGGCAAVICNTVGRSQAVYRALAARVAAVPEDERPEIILFHARFPFELRDEREKLVLQKFGKRGTTVRFSDGDREVQRPARAILVATSVVEQSLDLDFDLMITDLAPIDLLLQRAGRLHRHPADDRPAHLAAPVLHIIAPAVAVGLPVFASGDEKVYSEHVLLRTWMALRDRTGKPIEVPCDVEALIEAVYADRVCPADATAQLQEAWARTKEDLDQEREGNEQGAKDRSIPMVSFSRDLANLVTTPRDEDNPDLHPVHQALTRLARPSVQVVCLEEGKNGPVLPDGIPVDLETKPDRAIVERLLRRSVSLSDPRVVHRLLAEPVPPGWSRSALLRHHRVLAFKDGEAPVGSWAVSLEQVTGISISHSSSRMVPREGTDFR